MSQLGTKHRSADEIHEALQKLTAEIAEVKAKYNEEQKGRNCQRWEYSDTGRKYDNKLDKLRSDLRYTREKEFIESITVGSKITVLGNPRNGYRPTRILAEHNESMRIEGGGGIDIVELEITEIDHTENNSGVVGKNVHGKKSMKGVLIPRPSYINTNADPVYFYWLAHK